MHPSSTIYASPAASSTTSSSAVRPDGKARVTVRNQEGRSDLVAFAAIRWRTRPKYNAPEVVALAAAAWLILSVTVRYARKSRWFRWRKIAQPRTRSTQRDGDFEISDFPPRFHLRGGLKGGLRSPHQESRILC
jgi:hypothetical protein